MKISIKEAKKIVEEYNLGKFKSIALIPHGWVNFSFDLKTSKGRYILQILTGKINKWKADKIKLEFALLDYLNSVNFPYAVPLPLRNLNSQILTRIKGKPFWIYKRLNGTAPKRINEQQYKECAKALAIYHKYAEKFKFRTKYADFDNFNWILKMYQEMRKVKTKNKTDRLMLENIWFFEKIVNELKKMNWGKQRTFCHHDWHNGNLLFNKNKVRAIIDFNNIEVCPKVDDVALGIVKCRYLGRGYKEEKKKIFLKEYRKFMPFSKQEEKLITPLLLKSNCVTFWWFYKGMKKNLDKRHYALQECIREAKEYYAMLNNDKEKVSYVIIRGPLGIGKTTIAKRLANSLKATYISFDKILEENGLDKIDDDFVPEDFIKANKIILPLIKKDLASGKIVILDGCFYFKEQIKHLESELSSFNGVAFTLKAPLNICIERDSKRKKIYGPDAAKAVYKLVSKFDYGINIATENKSIKETVKEILNLINKS